MVTLGLLAVAVLLLALFVTRGEEVARAQPSSPRPPPSSTRTTYLALAAVLTLTLAPTLALGPWTDAGMFGDDMTHTRVGRDLAEHGLGDGWVDSYLSGFPYAVHYPPLGTLLVAALIALGLAPLTATHLLGMLGVLAVPLVLVAALLRAGVRPANALLAAFVSCAIAPFNAFVGGYEAFFTLGLLSQVLALPVCAALLAEIVLGRSPIAAVIFGALSMLAHPQLAIATLVVGGAALLAVGPRSGRAMWERYARAAFAMVAFGLATYGPGLSQMHVPFGWPPGMAWRQLGFPLSRLEPLLLDGWLLDYGRSPVVTLLLAAAVLGLLLQLKHPAARALCVAATLVVTLSVSGQTLLHSGALGRALLTVLQPLRVVALAGLVAPLLVAVTLELSVPRLEDAAQVLRPAWTRWIAPALVLLVALVLAPAALERLDYVRSVRAELVARRAQPCGPLTPPDYDGATLHAGLATLDHGRLWYQAHDRRDVGQCVDVGGAQLATRIPIATTNALGAHVGVAWSAFTAFDPYAPHSTRHAEALGIRYGIDAREHDWPGWRVHTDAGPLRVWEREGGTDLVAAGCVVESLYGSDDALRERLVHDFDTPSLADDLFAPHGFVEIVVGHGPVTSQPVEDCDASEAQVHETPRDVGAHDIEAHITSPRAIDVVVRVTAFSAWEVTLDGERVETLRMAAPGFLLVRVPEGAHVLRARPRWPEHYGWGLLGAVVVTALAALLRRRLATSSTGGTAAQP